MGFSFLNIWDFFFPCRFQVILFPCYLRVSLSVPFQEILFRHFRVMWEILFFFRAVWEFFSHSVNRRFSLRACWRGSSFCIIWVFLFPCRFQEIIFLCPCAFFSGGFSVRTKKYFIGFAIRFVFRRVSFCVPFLKEISGSLPFSFSAVLRKESHGILIPNILYQTLNPCHSPPVEENARITVQCSARKRVKTRPLFLVRKIHTPTN